MGRLALLLLVALAATRSTAEPPAQDVPAARVAVRAPVVETPEQPVRSAREGDGPLFVDFGRAAFGWLRIDFAEPMQATDLLVRLGEKAAGVGAVDDRPGGSIAYQQVAVKVADGASFAEAVPAWSPTHAHWVDIEAGHRQVAPFRYAEIVGLPPGSGPPRITRMSRHVAFSNASAAFACSEPALVEVWDLCRHSIKATSFLGIYVDGNRERVAYEADAYINQLCHYGLDAHYQTGRATLEHLLEHPTWPVEWRQQIPLIAWADWIYSGDAACLRRQYAAIRASAMLDRRRPDGLFVGQAKGVPRDIIDWPKGERDGYDMTCDVKTVTAAYHGRSLEALAAIAEAIGRDADAAEYRAMRDLTCRAMREKLYDETHCRFIDGLRSATGERSRHASLHANMFPLAFGLVPAADVPRVAHFVVGRGMACSVYGSQFLLDGLFDAGRESDAVALMLATGDRGWLHMRRDLGSTITLEAWDAVYKPNLDWNHAWGAVPANVIPRKLMGIEPLEPGFARVRVRPRVGALAWATIRHPTPRGPIDLAVRTSPDRWEADLSVPDGVAAELHVPTADPARVRVRGPGGADAITPRLFAEGCVVEVPCGGKCCVIVSRAAAASAALPGGGR